MVDIDGYPDRISGAGCGSPWMIKGPSPGGTNVKNVSIEQPTSTCSASLSFSMGVLRPANGCQERGRCRRPWVERLYAHEAKPRRQARHDEPRSLYPITSIWRSSGPPCFHQRPVGFQGILAARPRKEMTGNFRNVRSNQPMSAGRSGSNGSWDL